MGSASNGTNKISEVMYEILLENPDGLTSDQINYMLNNSIRPNKSSHTKSRLGGEGYSIRQIAGILRGNALFIKVKKRDPTVGYERNVYYPRPLEEAYLKALATKKNMKKFPRIIRNYHETRGEISENN
tara:strand:+ start:2309 stop:2695 length:387 start_codon:yes stop_codon:yes gene_type:complete